jgi:HEAT repeat protein
LLISLAMVAANVGSDEALASVVKLAHSNAFEQARGSAVRCLADFRQPQVVEELKGLATDENNYVRSAAVLALARRGNTAAIPMLLKLIETTALFRDTHVLALARFPYDPQAIAAIRAAQKDDDQSVRETANLAWKDVQAAWATKGGPTP